MGAIDWQKLLEANTSEITDDEDYADQLYLALTEGDLKVGDPYLSDPINVVKLFEVARSVASVKHMQYETCLEELEHVTQRELPEKAKEMQKEVEALREELAQYQRYTGSGDKYFRSEILQLEEKNKLLQREVDEFDRRLMKEQMAFDQMKAKLEDVEGRYQDARRELERATLDVKEYKILFQSQRESMASRRGDELEVRERMNKKNRELSEYLDEIKQLQSSNDKLQSEIGNARKELEDAAQDMHKMADDYTKLKSILEGTDSIVEDMRKERDILRAQVEDMQLQLQAKAQGDDQIMIALNKKVDEWKAILAAKDAEVSEKAAQVFALERQIESAKVDTDRQKVMDLMEACAKKDEQIKELKRKVELATEDYKDLTSQISTLRARSKDEAVTLHQQKSIERLNQTLQQEHLNTLKEREHAMLVEQDIIAKDQEIAQLWSRLKQYEQGTYGLSEAVQEIKDLRAQIRVRDKNIEQLTKDVNGLHIEVNDLNLANEEMLDRLGIASLDALDVDGIKKKRAVKEEQAQALARVLQKEVERLEEERLKLKEALRKQALDRGARAVELGLSHLDLEPVVALQPSKPSSRLLVPAQLELSDEPEHVEKTINNKSDEDYQNLLSQNRALEVKVKELLEENHQLEVGLREIYGSLKNADAGATFQTVVQIPALEKLIAIIDERHATGQYDTSVKLKAQLHELVGRNEELRRELGVAREEIKSAAALLDRRQLMIDQLLRDVDALKEVSEGVVKLNPLPLPEGILPTSKDIIACLNEYLIQVLQELSNKEDMCRQMEAGLEEFRRKFSVITHQQSILYKDHLSLKEEHEKDREAIAKEKHEYELVHEQNSAKLQEYERLLESLLVDPSKHNQLLAELSRKLTVLKVNEKSLARRYTILQEVETALRKENSKLKKDLMDMEAAVMQKISDLERHKELSTYKIAALQKLVDDMVPTAELELAYRQFNELTSKYRDLLQRENALVAQSSVLENIQAELRAAEHINNSLKEQLQLEKEKSYTLEQTVNNLLGSGHNHGGNVTDAEISSLARKLATLEMKELNERERANHAVRRYDQVKALIQELENRNSELELRFSEVSKLNLECQHVERRLRDDLANSVPADVNRADKKHILQLEEKQAKLSSEAAKLKEIADIAQHQAETILMRQQSQEKELMSLRRQLRELQMETDEKTVIAKLHQQIVALQVSEAAAVRKFEVCKNKLAKVEASMLKVQHLVDEKDEAMYHLRSEMRSKMRFLKKTIQDLRRQYSGALPIGHQERFSETLRTLNEKRQELEKQLIEARARSQLVEDRELELTVRYTGLQELIATLKDGSGAKKVAEWHRQMGEMRLQDVKLKRENDKLKEQCAYYEKTIKQHESAVAILEEQNIRQLKEYEDRQLLWEQHEVELERNIAKMEQQQQEMADAARKFEEATGSIPDESLPVANQLELAVRSVKLHIKTIILTRKEIQDLKEKSDDSAKRLRNAENALMQKEKIINELRLRLPITDRDVTNISDAAFAAPTPSSETEDRGSRQALKIAQTTVESLKLMLQKKDESLSKYQSMLATSREELKSQAESHRQEMKVLQDRLQLEIEEHIRKIRKVHHEYVNAPQPAVASSKQLTRLAELEEMVAEQDNALATGSEKYHRMKEQIKAVKDEAETNLKLMKAQLTEVSEKHSGEVASLKKALVQERQAVEEKDRLVQVLSKELEIVKEANERAPSKTMKDLVERLKNQLALKEKQQKALSQALLQLRSDMVTAAEDNVQAHAKKIEGELNVQLLVEKETSALNARVEDLQSRLEQLKKELKRKTTEGSEVQADVQSLRKDNDKKTAALKEMALELKKYEDVQERNENLTSELRACKEETEKLRERLRVQEDEAPVTAKESAGLHGQGFDTTDLDDKPVKEVKAKEEIARWEEGKKWQKKCDFLRARLKEKSDELEKLDKASSMLREALSRQEKEKLALQNRLKSMVKSTGDRPSTTPLDHEEALQTLKQRIFVLEDENNDLQRQLALDRNAEVQELRIVVNQQKETLVRLQSEEEKARKVGHASDAFQGNIRDEEDEKEVLGVRKHYGELKFENDLAKREIPRLKARVQDLEAYTQVLKSELDTLRKSDKSGKDALGTGVGGQSAEDMERVLAAQRRVVERLQTENDSLKKRGVKPVSQQSDLVAENRKLKQEIQRMKLSDSTELSKGTTVAKSNARMIKENDVLRKDLKREKEESEKLRIDHRNLEILNEKLQQEITDLREQLTAAEARAPVLGGADSKQWKSVVVSKMYEEKMKGLEAELQKKNSILQEVKNHLRGAAEREAALLRQVDTLEEKVALLENFPPGIETETDAVRQLQQTRLQVNRLEAEKEELTFELERLRRLTNNGEKPVDVTQDEILEKLRGYDKMLATEVELRTKIKTLEIEKDRIMGFNRKLKNELSAFDPAFFEELEDLKFNYKKAVERNVLYERQLRQLGKQFGVEVNIPHDDDYT